MGQKEKELMHYRRKLEYIYWREDADRVTLNNDQMKAKLKEVFETRKQAATKTRIDDYWNEDTYWIDRKGDWVGLYMKENGRLVVYYNNVMDDAKNKKRFFNADKLFQAKFKELNNGVGLQAAFGFIGKTLKRCIPKQFYYLNPTTVGKKLKMSSIDASSQYASGCLGRLPDAHTAILKKGRHEPTEEYPFAFYASGHCAEYGRYDTHEWLAHSLWPYMFRLGKEGDWPFRPLKDEEEETMLMKASPYTMDSTWRYFYDIKQSFAHDTDEYQAAKQVMVETMGHWHRKDSNKKIKNTYDDSGSFKLAHVVAVAICRGNQKILDKAEEIGIDLVAQICVDGILYVGSERFGAPEVELGAFNQEFTGVPTLVKEFNVYLAKNKDVYKFKHSCYDLIDGRDIDEDAKYDFADLDKLGKKERVTDLIDGKTEGLEK